MSQTTDDLRIAALRPLIPPAILMEELPLTERGSLTVSRTRARAGDIIHGRDDSLLVVVGPCSIHDVQAALEYGGGVEHPAPGVPAVVWHVVGVVFLKTTAPRLGTGTVVSRLPLATCCVAAVNGPMILSERLNRKTRTIHLT